MLYGGLDIETAKTGKSTCRNEAIADALFGQANVMKWLGCSKSKATNIMNVLKKAEVIEKVKGRGSGRYRFVNLQE